MLPSTPMATRSTIVELQANALVQRMVPCTNKEMRTKSLSENHRGLFSPRNYYPSFSGGEWGGVQPRFFENVHLCARGGNCLHTHTVQDR